MQDEDFSVKNVLIGVAGAIPLFLPLELLGLGNAAIVAGIAAGVTGYVYGDEIAEFAQKKLPQLQDDPKQLMRWLASRPGQQSLVRETTAINEQQTVKLVQETAQPKAALHVRRAIDESIPSSDVEETRIEREHWSFEDDEDEYEDDPTSVLPSSSEKVLFSSILANGFVPSLNKIYLASHPDGTPIYVAAKDLCHVALAGATGNGKCLEENEPVYLADGSIVSAKSLVGRVVQIVGVTDTQTMKQVPVLASFSDNGTREVIEIELDNGVVIRRTEEHPLWAAQLDENQHVGLYNVPSDGRRRSSRRTRSINAGWIKAQDLRVCGNRPNFDGHVILCPTTIHQQGTIPHVEADVILCAALLAEGCLTQQHSIGFTNADDLMVEAVTVAAKYYDCVLVPNLPKDKPNIQYRIVKTSRSKGGGRYAETKNGVLALLKEWKMTGTATEKSIPSWVFQLPDEQIATFLRVFVDCDGWFDDGHATGSPSVNVMLANPLLVRQLGQLALRLGIPGTYRSKENDNAGAWGWSSPHVDEWQRRIGSSVKKEVLARAVENKVLFESQSVRRWKTWRTARPVNGQKFADCPQGYEWRKIISIRRSVAPTIAVEVHNDNHAFVSDVVEHNTSIMRLLMTQLCKIRVRVLLLNPHYTRYDRDSGEDWTPFEKYLEKSPMECAEYAKIGECLQWMAKTELPKRIQRVREGKAAGRPFFVVVDELPAIVGEVRDAPVYISKLLREGRKYGIFLIVASQDFLVKTTGMDGGAVRKCFRTAFYVGGDGATARALLETGSPIAETKLGKGVIAIRCKDTQEAVEARVPYVDNDSVYQMLGPSTFADGRSQTDELNEDDLSYSQLYEQMTSSRPREDVVVDSPAQERMQPLPTPIIQERGPRAADIDIAVAITLWNAGYNSENKLMRAFPGLVKNQAHILRGRIVEQANVKQEEVE